jgi:hypothetical protein
MFVYNGVPGLGNLIFSIAPVPGGTDPYGNAFYPGACSYQPHAGSGTAFIVAQLFNGAISVGRPASIVGTGGESAGSVSGTSGPAGQLNIISGLQSGADFPAEIQLVSQLTAAAGAGPQALFQAYLAFVALANPTASGPFLYGTTNSAIGIKSVAMNGVVPVTQANYTAFTNTTTSFNQMSFLWPVGFGDFYNNVLYRFRAWGNGVQGSTQQQLNCRMSAFGLTFGSNSMPATDIPASASFHWEVEYDIIINGSTGIIYGGHFTWSQAAVTANRGTAAIDGNASPLPGGNTNITLQMSWGSTTGAPTVTQTFSSLERLAM